MIEELANHVNDKIHQKRKYGDNKHALDDVKVETRTRLKTRCFTKMRTRTDNNDLVLEQ